MNGFKHNWIKIVFIFLLASQLDHVAYSQCNVAGFTATPTNGTCFANGSISVQVPGASTCSGWVAILTPQTGGEQTLTIPANGGPVVFGSLAPGNYNVRLFNGSTTIQASNNPIAITTTYVSPVVTSTSTQTTCNPAASNYTPNATVTVNIASGTGTGPFVYTLPGGTISPSAPTMARSYTFTGLAAGTHSFTVTDQQGVSGCEVVVGQSRVIAPNSTPLPVVGTIRYRRVDCPIDCDNYVLYFPATNRVGMTAVISINGGPDTPMPYTLTSINYVDGYMSPTVSAGDTYTATFTNGCHTIVLNGTVPPVDQVILSVVGSSTTPSCGVVNYQIGVNITSAGSGNRYFCNDATTFTISGITGSFSMVPFASGGTGSRSVAVPGSGTYTVTVTDGCNTEVRNVIIPAYTINTNAVTVSPYPSFRENSAGMYFNAPIPTSNLTMPHTYSIMPADGTSSKVLNSSNPYNLAGSFTINFPIVRTVTNTASSTNERLVRDLPLGEYDVTFTDACGNTITRRVNLTNPATYNPVVTIEQGCENSSNVVYALNAPDLGVFNSGRVRLFTNSGGSLGTLVSTIHAEGVNSANGYKNGFVNNLTAGNYFLVFDRVKNNMVWGYSPIPNAITDEEYRIPFTILPYQPITVNVESTLCDYANSSSGIVSAEITGGTPVYPLTWQLFSPADSLVPLQTFVANSSSDPNAMQQNFSGLSPGDYFVRASSACYGLNVSTSIQLQEDFPPINISNTNICSNANNEITMSTPLSGGVQSVIWTNDLGDTLGTGSSLTTTVTRNTIYTVEVVYIPLSGCGTPSVIEKQIYVFYHELDTDGDGIPDYCDLDDDNDGIVDSYECSNGYSNMLAVFGAGGLSEILPSDLGLALNVKNQDVSADLSAKFGYPASSGALIVSIKNASVHPITDAWWTKDGEDPSVWTVSGSLSSFLVMAHDDQYYGNDNKTFHIYDEAPVFPVEVPGFANQVPVAGQWAVIQTASQKTLSNLDGNVATNEFGQYRYVHMAFGDKTFGFSSTTKFGEPTYAVLMYLECDVDLDGIPNRLDLDSDNDGCVDAYEGDEMVTYEDLVTAGGVASSGLGSPAGSLNLCASGTCVNAQGVPMIVNAGGSADICSNVGQGFGSAYNMAVNICVCVNPGDFSVDGQTSLTGISDLEGFTNGWPTIVPNGHVVIESRNKGFVITRVNSSDDISNPVEGMIVYDIADQCVELYNGTIWSCLQQSCNFVQPIGICPPNPPSE